MHVGRRDRPAIPRVHGADVVLRCSDGNWRVEAPDLRKLGADDGIRTRDPHLGKVVLYR